MATTERAGGSGTASETLRLGTTRTPIVLGGEEALLLLPF